MAKVQFFFEVSKARVPEQFWDYERNYLDIAAFNAESNYLDIVALSSQKHDEVVLQTLWFIMPCC